MNRSHIAVTLPLVALLCLALPAFADDGAAPKPETTTTTTAAAPPAVATNAVPREVAPNVGGYGLTYGPFKYDPAGNIIAIGNDYYVYDPMGRLTTASTNRPDQPGAQTQTYTYDAYGNRTAVDGVAQNTSTANNRLTSYGAVYDAAGNLTQWQPPGSAYTRNYTYDALGMITKESTGSQWMVYVYTASDERLWNLEGLSNGQNRSHWTVRDLGGRVLRDFFDDGTDASSDWALYREYVYRGHGLLSINTSNGTQHVTLDHIGSPRLITDGLRYKLYHHHYKAFGEEWTTGSDPADPTTLRFTGHERDFDLHGVTAGNKDYMHARYYAPKLGRFFSTDPIISGFSMQNPQGWNRYAYVTNNPVNLIDPYGMAPCTFKLPDGRTVQGECITVVGTYPWDSVARDSALWDAILMAEAMKEIDRLRDLDKIRDFEVNRPCPAIPEAPPGVDLAANIATAEKHRPATFEQYQWFKSMYTSKAVNWDYKRLNGGRYENFGNFNYGATGAAMGIPDEILMRAAGAFQQGKPDPSWGKPWHLGPPYGDDPKDIPWVRRGIEHYRKGC